MHPYSPPHCLIKFFFSFQPNSLLEEVSVFFFHCVPFLGNTLVPVLGCTLCSPPVHAALIPRKEDWVVQTLYQHHTNNLQRILSQACLISVFQRNLFISELSGCCWGLLAEGTSYSLRVSPDDRKKGQDWAAPLQARGDAWCLGSLRGPAPSHTILSKAGSVQ